MKKWISKLTPGQKITIITAIVAAFAVIISAILQMPKNTEAVQMIIDATQTAETKLTHIAMVVTPVHPTSTVVMPSPTDAILIQPSATPTQSSQVDSLSTPYYYQLPTPEVIGKQLDFSPILIDVSTDEIPYILGLNETPHDGIYISQLWVFRSGDISWMAYYKDGSSVLAESEICVIVKDYPEEYQAPMNLKASEVILPVSVYTANHFTLKLTGAKILLSNYYPSKPDIDYLQPFSPGGGGSGSGFVEAPYAILLPVLATETVVEPTTMEYTIDFKWFEIESRQGVEIDFPVMMIEPGTYQFQVQIFAIAYDIFNGKDENIVLTTGRDSYTWARIDDPRKYPVYRFAGESLSELELCP